MSDFINTHSQAEDSPNCFYNSTTENTSQAQTSLFRFGCGNNEWIWLILIALVFLNGKDLFGGCDGKSSNMLILIILAFFFFSNTSFNK
ncbi:hypothetical protein PBV87_01075 [Niameybacter massiliensis]|uniref:Uncharacterized protein n=1 Tax=Holtiella tumoricola TaxID=3018743 RepID=A0AA42DJR0_9FIRM|nr:hypothetical protein [Holtiella tumoricola]MDA3730106.1 hypothetical protein [Holtiella tumoricola]